MLQIEKELRDIRLVDWAEKRKLPCFIYIFLFPVRVRVEESPMKLRH